MYNKLTELVNNGEWELAEEELNLLNDKWDDELAILKTAIYWQKEDYEQVYECIAKGLEYNYRNYELYLLLGNYYEAINPNQAWLCYENAEFYCDNMEDLKIIRQYKQNLEKEGRVDVEKTAIVILTYNLQSLTQECIESIRKNNLDSSYELVIVDNHSTDGTREWLLEQEDIKLICNEENKGFPYGCNQGIKAAGPEYNILLLNNDTIVTPNAIFWLRMGLYEEDRVGATGSVSNFVGNGQRINKQFSSLEEYIQFSEKNNIPKRNPYEKKIFLVGFALMLKRSALDTVGLLDIEFSPGMYEDDDIGLRLQRAGYQVILCQNSFIYHYGSGDGKHLESWNKLLTINGDKLKEKWKFDIRYYTWARMELIGLITKKQDEPIRVLEIGCGMGATLAKIKYLWPKAEVKGIELVEQIASIGSNSLDIIQGNAESMEFPYEKNSFDYIILGDVLEHLYDPGKLLRRMTDYLKEGGEFLCSIPNLMHMSVIVPLLQGKFDYQDAGILDRTHIKFFTLDSIVNLFHECNLQIEEIKGTSDKNFHTQENIEIIESISKLPCAAPKEWFEVYQYIFRAKREER